MLDELVDKFLEVVENVFVRFYSVVVFAALVVYSKRDGQLVASYEFNCLGVFGVANPADVFFDSLPARQKL